MCVRACAFWASCTYAYSSPAHRGGLHQACSHCHISPCRASCSRPSPRITPEHACFCLTSATIFRSGAPRPTWLLHLHPRYMKRCWDTIFIFNCTSFKHFGYLGCWNKLHACMQMLYRRSSHILARSIIFIPLSVLLSAVTTLWVDRDSSSEFHQTEVHFFGSCSSFGSTMSSQCCNIG